MRARVLVSPLWLGAVGLLLLNDHVLKYTPHVPRLVSGKLSDVAGMFVAPLLLAVLLGVRSRAGLAACHVATGAVFAAIKLSPAAAWMLESALATVGIGWRIWTDPSDLLVAVPSLYAAFALYAPTVTAAPRPSPRAGSRISRTELGAAIVGIAACIASQPPRKILVLTSTPVSAKLVPLPPPDPAASLMTLEEGRVWTAVGDPPAHFRFIRGGRYEMKEGDVMETGAVAFEPHPAGGLLYLTDCRTNDKPVAPHRVRVMFAVDRKSFSAGTRTFHRTVLSELRVAE